ncbi:MAG: glycoside hydrolase family 44 protein [Armatimonadota bacterium]
MKRFFAVFFALLSSLSFGDQSVFSDQLDSAWQNWSWASTNTSNVSPTHSGVRSISVSATGVGQALYLHHNAQSAVGYQSLTFWIHGGTTGGQLLKVQGTLDGNAIPAYSIPALTPNAWTKVVVPLKGLGVRGARNFDGFWIQDRSGAIQGTYYVDDVSLVSEVAPPPTSTVFTDSLQNSWQNWSWATVSLTNSSPVHSGSASVSVHEVNAFDGFYAHHASLDSSLYKTLSFWIHGGAGGGQMLQVYATASGVGLVPFAIPTLSANSWTQVVIPLSSLGMRGRGDFDGFFIQGRVNAPQATYYLDDISVSVAPMVNPATTITIDPRQKFDISPLIYGANSTDYAGMGSGFRFARSGGNRLTAYNWENNASNAGSDWFFQNDGYLGSTNEAGWTDRTFIQAALAAGAVPLVTIPCAGYVSADKNGDGDVRNSPNYLSTRFKVSVPSKPGGSFAYPPNVNDGFVYQDECVNYLKQFAQPGLPIMFSLDNEPDLWSSTHAEIHPSAATYAEMITRSTDYASAIKNVYPSATVFGPVNYGWYGFMALQGAPDQNGRNFLDVYLDGMRVAGNVAGKRLLDVMDVHWYPEAKGDDTRITSDGDTQGLSQARIQSTRSLWDSTYVEDSWITQSFGNQSVNLLPMLTGRIRAHYPGTKLSITEYNYGGSNAISGAIAQADALGLFGRNGVYAAANWGLNAEAKAQLAGFKAFINYDRLGSRFGDQGLFVTGEKASENSCYAAVDSTNPNRITVVFINKTEGTTPFKLNLSGYQVKSSKSFTIVDQQFEVPITGGISSSRDNLKFSAPPESITTLELFAYPKK